MVSTWDQLTHMHIHTYIHAYISNLKFLCGSSEASRLYGLTGHRNVRKVRKKTRTSSKKLENNQKSSDKHEKARESSKKLQKTFKETVLSR